jgi:hypothetical protein
MDSRIKGKKMIRIEIKKINNYPYLGMRNYITLVLFFNKDKGLCLNDINDFSDFKEETFERFNGSVILVQDKNKIIYSFKNKFLSVPEKIIKDNADKYPYLGIYKSVDTIVWFISENNGISLNSLANSEVSITSILSEIGYEHFNGLIRLTQK